MANVSQSKFFPQEHQLTMYVRHCIYVSTHDLELMTIFINSGNVWMETAVCACTCIPKYLNPLNYVTSNTCRRDLQLTTVLYNYTAGRGFFLRCVYGVRKKGGNMFMWTERGHIPLIVKKITKIGVANCNLYMYENKFRTPLRHRNIIQFRWLSICDDACPGIQWLRRMITLTTNVLWSA